jgi:hypothetical protein
MAQIPRKPIRSEPCGGTACLFTVRNFRRARRPGNRHDSRRDQGHAHQVRETRGLHLGHDVCPVDLDRARADSEFVRNRLVGVTGDKALQHLPFAGGERRQPFLDLRPFAVPLRIQRGTSLWPVMTMTGMSSLSFLSERTISSPPISGIHTSVMTQPASMPGTVSRNALPES